MEEGKIYHVDVYERDGKQLDVLRRIPLADDFPHVSETIYRVRAVMHISDPQGREVTHAFAYIINAISVEDAFAKFDAAAEGAFKEEFVRFQTAMKEQQLKIAVPDRHPRRGF